MEKSKCRFPSIDCSMQKLCLGFCVLYPINNASVFFSLDSSKSQNMSLPLIIDIIFLPKFTKRGAMERIAAFVSVVNGVICNDVIVDMGARPARTIRQRASAPPNMPNRHNARATGATIMEIAVIFMVFQKSGFTNNSKTATAANPIHKISLISLFLISRIHASPSITNAVIICTSPGSKIFIESHTYHVSVVCFPKLVDQFYMLEIETRLDEVLFFVSQSQN